MLATTTGSSSKLQLVRTIFGAKDDEVNPSPKEKSKRGKGKPMGKPGAKGSSFTSIGRRFINDLTTLVTDLGDHRPLCEPSSSKT